MMLDANNERTDLWVFGIHAGGEALQAERVQRFDGADIGTGRQQEDGQGREQADLVHAAAT